MKLIRFDSTTGIPYSEPVTSIDLGEMGPGDLLHPPVVLKAYKTVESNILSMRVLLSSDGGLTGSSFVCCANRDFFPGVGYTGQVFGSVDAGLTGAVSLGGTGLGVTGGIPLGTTGGVELAINRTFTVEPGATGWPIPQELQANTVALGVTGGNPDEYLWLGLLLGTEGSTGPVGLSYRFLYDYN